MSTSNTEAAKPQHLLDEDNDEKGNPAVLQPEQPAAHSPPSAAADLEQGVDDIDLAASSATLRPSASQQKEMPPPPPPKDTLYLDPTPKTPTASHPPSRSPSQASMNSRTSHAESKDSDKDQLRVETNKRDGNLSETDDESKTEIQSIMEQFEDGGPGADEVMSPRLERAGPFFPNSPHLNRQNSLEPEWSTHPSVGVTSPSSASLATTGSRGNDEHPPPLPPKPASPVIQRTVSLTHVTSDASSQGPSSPLLLHKPPPPEPDPEPDLPFDFHRFLEQLRHRSADPVARFLRSFLSEFGKKQWMVHEQVKIISDFLSFITNKMAQCEVWRDVSDAEFDNAREGMEKLVMNRLYSQTFSPAIPPPAPMTAAQRKRRTDKNPPPGRRGQHQEDVERDEILAQKVRIYGWVREQHLDIQPVGDSGRKFLSLAQQELLKIKTYRAPRDKVICVLNSCKVIFGLLRHSKSDMSADAFVPLLIYVVLQANPEHLVSNLQYILRFRNSEKLGGEAGYYLSSLMGAVQFIESLDRSSLTVSDAEFEKNVEAAVAAIAEKHEREVAPELPEKLIASRARSRQAEEGEAGGSSSHRRGLSSLIDENFDEKTPVAGLLQSIQRPLNSIGRMFSEGSSGPAQGSVPGPNPGLANAAATRSSQTPSDNSASIYDDPSNLAQAVDAAQKKERSRLSAEDAAARQASAEAAEAQRIQSAEHANVVGILAGMFPDLDRDLIDDVVRMKEGRVHLAVDACLALST